MLACCQFEYLMAGTIIVLMANENIFMGRENKGTLFFLERNTLFRIQKNEIRVYHKMLCIKHPRISIPLKKYRIVMG